MPTDLNKLAERLKGIGMIYDAHDGSIRSYTGSMHHHYSSMGVSINNEHRMLDGDCYPIYTGNVYTGYSIMGHRRAPMERTI